MELSSDVTGVVFGGSIPGTPREALSASQPTDPVADSLRTIDLSTTMVILPEDVMLPVTG